MVMVQSGNLLLLLLISLKNLSRCRAFSITRHNHRQYNAVRFAASDNPEEADIVIVGGGISGLTAAITVSTEEKSKSKTRKIVLLESQSTLGGRVRSTRTPEGYILDRGFAVFLTAYPQSQILFDYDALELRSFVSGALLRIPSKSNLNRVGNPLLHPRYLLPTLTTPVGTIRDKFRLVPLIVHVIFNSIPSLFSETEMDTYSCLTKGRYRFSERMVDEFFRPFLEGIYLCPLEEQSSRMLHFVLRMFVLGKAALPTGGMQTVSDQLVERARELGVDIRVDHAVTEFSQAGQGIVCTTTATRSAENDGSKQSSLCAKSVILATEGTVAQRLVSTLEGYKSLAAAPQQTERSAGCLYYGFDTPPPIDDGVLILNGEGGRSGKEGGVINNLCFLSNVNDAYAPSGRGLCSVTVLENKLQKYNGLELDSAVRSQLGKWFPEIAKEIQDKWVLLEQQIVKKAQPSQLGGAFPASWNGGRNCGMFREMVLPDGFYICGDHMATATLNGAIESGVNAGKTTSAYLT